MAAPPNFLPLILLLEDFADALEDILMADTALPYRFRGRLQALMEEATAIQVALEETPEKVHRERDVDRLLETMDEIAEQ